VAQWRIYYDDDRIRSHKDGLPVTADDKLGVLVIVQLCSDGAIRKIYGAEYYIFEGKYWVPVKENGLEDWAMNKLNLLPKDSWCVTKGRAIPRGYYNKIFEEARKAERQSSLD